MKLTKSIWSQYCTNQSCGYFFSREGGEPEAVCQRCGSPAGLNEHITITEYEENNIDDLHSN